MDLRFPNLQEHVEHLRLALQLAQDNCILFLGKPGVGVVHVQLEVLFDLLPFLASCYPLDSFKCNASRCLHPYARLPQHVLEGDGRGTLPLGVGVDSLPKGRAVFATDGLGSRWAGLVPPPNAMVHPFPGLRTRADARGAASF
jgi:hypothetical protein